jgi:malate-CoA ligase subunit beta
MDIHEYQAKEILAKFGVPIPRGALAYSPEQAATAPAKSAVSSSCQGPVHTGGRGKPAAQSPAARTKSLMLPTICRQELVTHQSGPLAKSFIACMSKVKLASPANPFAFVPTANLSE